MPYHLGLEDHAPLRPPALGGIAAFPIEVLGLAALFREFPRLLHRGFGQMVQHRIFGHRHHIFHAHRVQKRQQERVSESAVQSHSQARLGKGPPQLLHDAPEDADSPYARHGIAGPQHRREQVLLLLVVEAHKSHHRQIAPAIVMAIEEAELLRAMGRIVGRVQIEGNEPGPAMQPAAMTFDHALGQCLAQAVKLLAVRGILKPREGGLRSQIRALDRIAPHQQLVHRVLGQAGRIISIGIATSDAVDALPQQLLRLMLDFRRLPFIDQASRQAFGQSQTPVGRLEQDRAPIGTALPLVKLRDHWPRKYFRKQQTLCCGIVSQAEASFGHSNIVSTTCLYHRRLFVSLRNVNYAG